MKTLAEFNKNHLNKILFNQTLKINIKYCGKYFKIPQNKQINRHMMPNGWRLFIYFCAVYFNIEKSCFYVKILKVTEML